MRGHMLFNWRVVPVSLVLLGALAGADQRPGKKPPERKKTAEHTVTRAGCLDQRDEKYVLASEDEMRTVTELAGRAFSSDNFARFVGQKVRVRGAMDKGAFQVDEIDKVADSCR